MTPEQIDALEKEADDMIAALQQQGESSDASTSSGADVPQVAEGVAAEPLVLDGEAPAVADTAQRSEEASADTANVVPVERYKNAEKRMHEATQQAAEMRRQNQALEARVQALELALQQASSAGNAVQKTHATDGSEASLQDDDELRELDEFYPEIAKPVRAKLSRFEQAVKQIQGHIQKQQAVEQQAVASAHIEAIQAAHPDAYQLAQDPQFQAWVAAQPPLLQAAVQSGTAADVIHVLDSYKAGRGVAAHRASAESRTPTVADARRASTPQVGRMTSAVSQPKWTREQIAAMPLAEFEKYEREIDEALAAGLIA